MNIMPETVYQKLLFLRLLNEIAPKSPNRYAMHVVQNVPCIPHFNSAACTSLARECCGPLGRDKEEIRCLLLVGRITECRGNIHNSQFI